MVEKNKAKHLAQKVTTKAKTEVKNIYCFDDALGIDADCMFSFHCNAETSNKIIQTHQLTINKANTDNAFGLQHDFDWWNKERIKQLQKYSWTDGANYHKYFWYDTERKSLLLYQKWCFTLCFRNHNTL